MMSNLLQPLTLPCGVVIHNRILKSAMSEGMGSKDFSPNEKHITLYQRFKEGGSGIVVTGNVMIDETALGEPKNVVIEDERHLDALKAWAKAGHSEESALWVQLNHPGKQSPRFITKTPVAPSAVPLSGMMKSAFNQPRALELDEIKDIINRFKEAARIVKKAGFGGVQIHGAHGYLVSQFLSPHHNRRTDQYGGSLENRMRFLVEIYDHIRDVVGPTFPVGVKMNIDDFNETGFQPEEAIQVIRTLEEKGIDLVELSGGTYEKPVMMGSETEEGFFLKALKAVNDQFKVPIVITGGFRSLSVMEKVLDDGLAMMIGLARPLVLEPDMILNIKKGTFKSVELPRITTGFKRFDRSIGAVLGLSAYAYQLQRLATKRPVKITRNAYKVLLSLMFSHGLVIFKRRRA